MARNNTFNIQEYDFHSLRHKEMQVFTIEEFRKARDILEIGYALFELEKILKNPTYREYQINRFIDNNAETLKQIFSDLIAFVLLKKVNFSFTPSDIKLKLDPLEIDFPKPKTVVLFSGGIDSFSGIDWANKKFNKNIVGAFCAHSDQSWSIHIVNEIINHVLKPNNIRINTIYTPPMRKGGYSQLRGLLYILSAGALMEVLKADNLVISECGPTMYQPKFGLFDYVTMTTHPVVVESAYKILHILIGRKINFYLPFENLTKSEVISVISNPGYIPSTHSCISQRFGKHDGTCYGCILRRLGTIVAGVKDTEYNKDPLIDKSSNSDNLLSLLMFSQNILTDYENMPYYQIENIESYGKQDLFRRFALDNFAAIFILKSNKVKLTREVDRLFLDCIDQVGIEVLEERIEQVRNHKFTISSDPKYIL